MLKAQVENDTSRRQEKAPLVSIVTICLNSVSAIRYAIESVLGQQYPNVEYIVIDGGSSDGTLSIVNEYRDRITMIISERDDGIADAFNKGLRIASGELIGFLNADDVYLQGSLSNFVDRYIRSGRTVDLLYGDAICVQKGHPMYIVQALPLAEANILTPFICHQSILAKRSLFDAVGGFNKKYRYGMDYDWVLRSLKSGAHFEGFKGEPVVNYSTEGFSANNSLKALLEFRQIALANGLGRYRVNSFYTWKVAKALVQQLLYTIGLRRLIFALKARYKSIYRPV